MGLCVAISGGAVVEAAAETFPDCSEYALITADQAGRLTYWADVSEALAPGSAESYELMAAILLLFVTALGVKMVVRLLLNR